MEVRVRLAKWQLAFLRQESRERRVSMSDVIRDLILKEKVRRQSSPSNKLVEETTNGVPPTR